VTSTLPVRRPVELTVMPLSDTEWRISDPSHDADDPFSLVGFVQRVGTMFEVIVIGLPGERHYCGSLDGALRHLRRAPRPKHAKPY
jgi:hypothetical protein